MIKFAAKSHPGRRAGENEDAFGFDSERSLAFVADGMGGHAAGSVASSIVKDTLLKGDGTLQLDDLVRSAHAAVASAAEANPEYRGMGSTVVCASIADRRARIIWVGDSRGYLWRHGTLRRLTRDHSFAEILSQEQGLSASEIRSHPGGHVVTQTLGLGTPEPSVNEMPLRGGDWILLCSDGLTDELDDGAIRQALAHSSTVEQGVDRLVEGALNHGGNDNVSVVLVGYEDEHRGRRLTAGKIVLFSIVSGVGVALACAAAWWYFFERVR
jgi:PPM family protein phosphatase